MNNNDVLNVNLKASEEAKEEITNQIINSLNHKINSTMEGERTVEKHYCYNHPSAYCNNNGDALALAALAGRNNMDCNSMWPMMMMGGGLGMNQWMNNPFAYMMMMAWMRNFNGGWGDGNMGGQNAQNIEMQNQLQAIRTQLQDGQNTNALLDAVRGGTAEVGRLADRWNCDFNTLNAAVCDVRAAIQQVGGQVGYSAERVINAAQMGDMNIITQLKDCCCQNKELIQRMGYENQLGQKDIISSMQQGFCDLGYKLQGGLDFVNRSIERGFSAVGFEAERNKCDIVNAINAAQQRTADQLNNHWKEELAGKLQKAEFENSQLKQNQYLASLINGGCGCGVNNQ